VGRSAREARARVLLIRRPDRSSTYSRRVYLASSKPQHQWIEELDLTSTAHLAGLDLSLLDSDQPPGIGTPGPADGVRLVCTNGRHDPCCADLGRPVVRALAASGAADTWESSHVGGDRFAANLVFLPTGVYYGRVPPDDAARVAGDHAEGLLALEYYRGRSCYQPLAQAAEIFARRELGERRLDGVRPVSTVAEDADTAAVVLAHPDGPLQVRVRRERAPAELLTCSAAGPAEPWAYRLVDLSALAE
jgi:hypothetical protein